MFTRNIKWHCKTRDHRIASFFVERNAIQSLHPFDIFTRTFTIYIFRIFHRCSPMMHRAHWMHTVCVYPCRFENQPIMRTERAQSRYIDVQSNATRYNGAVLRNALSDSLELRCSRLQLSAYAPALNPLLAIRSEIAGAWLSLSIPVNDSPELCRY